MNFDERVWHLGHETLAQSCHVTVFRKRFMLEEAFRNSELFTIITISLYKKIAKISFIDSLYSFMRYKYKHRRNLKPSSSSFFSPKNKIYIILCKNSQIEEHRILSIVRFFACAWFFNWWIQCKMYNLANLILGLSWKEQREKWAPYFTRLVRF